MVFSVWFFNFYKGVSIQYFLLNFRSLEIKFSNSVKFRLIYNLKRLLRYSDVPRPCSWLFPSNIQEQTYKQEKYKDHKEQVQGYFSPPYGSPKTLKNVKNFPSLPKPWFFLLVCTTRLCSLKTTFLHCVSLSR